MKRILLFASIIIAGLISCKKSDDNLDNFTMIGMWEIIDPAPVRNNMSAPDTYLFKPDHTYSRVMMGDIGESGTYSIKLTGDPRIFEITMTRWGRDTPGESYVILIEKMADTKMKVTYNDNLYGVFVRRPM